MVELAKVKGVSAWQTQRREIEAAIKSVLGKMPKEQIDVQAKIMDEIDYPGYTRRRVNYFVDEWSRIGAWVFIPEDAEEVQAVLCLHRMTALGKDEPAGLEGASPLLTFAKHYAELGYVTIAPDCVTAGERTYSKMDPFDTTTFYKENSKMSAVGKMLWDHMRCVDVLLDTKEVDPGRIGVIGHGLGAMNALFLAAMDDRIRACVASSGISSIAAESGPGPLGASDGFVMMPKMRAALDKGDVPFDWEHMLALIAPVPTLLLTSMNDDTVADPGSCKDIVKRAQGVYKLFGEPQAVDQFIHKGGDGITPEALDMADGWLERWL